MSNYSSNPDSVRVDLFKPSGKWYTTIEMTWLDYTGNIHDIFCRSLFIALGSRYSEMDAICLEPHHEHSHPIQIKAGGWIK